METIRKHQRLASQMTNEQAVEFFTSQRDNLDPKVAQLPQLAKPWGKFKNCAAKLESIYKRPRALPQTETISMYEEERNSEFMYICNYVYNVLQYSSFDGELVHARVLEPVLKNHAGLSRLEYEAETAAITDLIEKLEVAGVVEHVAALGLAAHLANFKQLNLSFKESYKERSDTRYEYKREGSLTKFRKEVSDAFAVFTESLNSLRSMYTEPAQLALLEEIIISINATTYQFTIIVHRHLGYLASKGKQTPDITNPEVPGGGGDGGEGGDGGYQIPDITNPPFGE